MRIVAGLVMRRQGLERRPGSGRAQKYAPVAQTSVRFEATPWEHFLAVRARRRDRPGPHRVKRCSPAPARLTAGRARLLGCLLSSRGVAYE